MCQFNYNLCCWYHGTTAGFSLPSQTEAILMISPAELMGKDEFARQAVLQSAASTPGDSDSLITCINSATADKYGVIFLRNATQAGQMLAI